MRFPLLAVFVIASAAHAQQKPPDVTIITPDAPLVTAPQPTPTPTPTVKPTPTPSAEEVARQATALARQVLRETSAIRQLPIKREVPAGVQNSTAIEKMAGGEIAKSLNSDEILGNELLLKKLGLAPANFDLKRYYVSMLGEQLAGYYDTKTKKFYTTERVDRWQLETVMAHELTHALQDQSFDLTRLEKWPRHEGDAKLAMTALVEGDATYTMMRYMMHNPLRALGMMASSMAPKDSPVLVNGPRALRDSLIFPYMEGMKFVTALYKSGGWNSVSAAFKRLPQSSEQIMHVEKYLRHEAPQRVAPVDLSARLGKGWRRLDHDVNGEIGFKLILADFVDADRAANAAAGWAGDRYAIYSGPHQQALFAQVCLWDSEADAREFFDAYALRTNLRYKIQPAQSSAARRTWKTAEGDVWMERRGQRVVILEGLPTGAKAASLAAPLWK